MEEQINDKKPIKPDQSIKFEMKERENSPWMRLGLVPVEIQDIQQKVTNKIAGDLNKSLEELIKRKFLEITGEELTKENANRVQIIIPLYNSIWDKRSVYIIDNKKVLEVYEPNLKWEDNKITATQQYLEFDGAEVVKNYATWNQNDKSDDIELSNNKLTANFLQVVEGSHRWTLYGLQQELIMLRSHIEHTYDVKMLQDVDHILKGLQNAIDAGEDVTKLI